MPSDPFLHPSFLFLKVAPPPISVHPAFAPECLLAAKKYCSRFPMVTAGRPSQCPFTIFTAEHCIYCVWCLIFSPDEKTFAFISFPTISIYDSKTGHLISGPSWCSFQSSWKASSSSSTMIIVAAALLQSDWYMIMDLQLDIFNSDSGQISRCGGWCTGVWHAVWGDGCRCHPTLSWQAISGCREDVRIRSPTLVWREINLPLWTLWKDGDYRISVLNSGIQPLRTTTRQPCTGFARTSNHVVILLSLQVWRLTRFELERAFPLDIEIPRFSFIYLARWHFQIWRYPWNYDNVQVSSFPPYQSRASLPV